MGDTLSHIADLYDEYRELCFKFNEEPKSDYDNHWFEHYKSLRDKDESNFSK